MANKKLSAITASAANAAAADGLVGVQSAGGPSDVLFSPQQVLNFVASLAAATAAQGADGLLAVQGGAAVLQTVTALFNLAITSIAGGTVNIPNAPGIVNFAGSASANVIGQLPAAVAGTWILFSTRSRTSGSTELLCTGTDSITFNGSAGTAGGNLKTTTGLACGLIFAATGAGAGGGVWYAIANGVWTLT
jgi:hypothetical protein